MSRMSQGQPASTTLWRWAPPLFEDQQLRLEYLAFVTDDARLYRETSRAQHLTVSAFVFDRTLDHIVLCHHRRGRFWVQLGGHIEEADGSLAAAARREAREESGLLSLTSVGGGPVDLDRHELRPGFGSCQVHWDVGFAFTADLAHQLVVSEESESVGWWPVDALPAGSVGGLAERCARIRDAVSIS